MQMAAPPRTSLMTLRTSVACVRPRAAPPTTYRNQSLTPQEKRHENFLQDAVRWRGNNHFGHHDFRHERSKGVQWLEDRCKPAWLDSPLPSSDAQQEIQGRLQSRLALSPTSVHDAGPCRIASYEKDVHAVDATRVRQEEELNEIVEKLRLMVQRGSFIDRSLLFAALQRCIAQKDLVLGRRVHSLVLTAGYESDAFLANNIIRMYAFHGKLEEARQVFSKVAAPNTFLWYSLISTHAEHGEPTYAIQLYRTMRKSSIKPNSYVFVAVLKACAASADLVSGKEVHADILQSSVELNIFIGSCLVDMYSKCGSLDNARSVFDAFPRRNVVTWNAMLAGYVQQGLGQEAIALYATMQKDRRTPADRLTFACLLQACSSIGALHLGKKLHSEIVQKDLEADVVIGSCLVDMYVKCGSLEDARRVFDSTPMRNVVTWTAMIAGYVQHGLGQEALILSRSMSQNGITPSGFTFSCLLKACASIGAIHEGKQLHLHIQERGLGADVVVGNSLVDMYATCGSLKEARQVFDALPSKDVVTWNSLLNGYAHHGYGQQAMLCFKEMQEQGVEPDQVTFICLLVACSHEGLVYEGQQYFKMMVDAHGIVPTIRHYVCMVDLLGRAGYLEEAERMLQTMPFENDVVGWTSLLTACKIHGDVDRGKQCFSRLVALEPDNAVAYVLLGSMYGSAGRWKDVDMIESLRKSAGAWKKPAKACIEVKNKVHEFIVGEERGDVSLRLRSLNRHLKEDGGHVPHTELVLKALTESEKEDALCGHAEKLALAYGLMNTPDGATLLVTKNLRMCNDCHSGTKTMSRLEQREIIVRDAHRVHRFVNGSCSCGDWH